MIEVRFFCLSLRKLNCHFLSANNCKSGMANNCPFVINDPLLMLEFTHTHNNSIQHDFMKEYLVIRQNNQELFKIKSNLLLKKMMMKHIV